MERYRETIKVIVSGVIGLAASIGWYVWRRAYGSRLDGLVRHCLTELGKQEQLADDDRTGQTVRYIPINRLQDSLFPSHRPGRIWNDVVRKVEANSNVRSRTAEVHGEITKVWERI